MFPWQRDMEVIANRNGMLWRKDICLGVHTSQIQVPRYFSSVCLNYNTSTYEVFLCSQGFVAFGGFVLFFALKAERKLSHFLSPAWANTLWVFVRGVIYTLFLHFHFLREKISFCFRSLCIVCGVTFNKNGQIPRCYWGAPSCWYCTIWLSSSFSLEEL